MPEDIGFQLQVDPGNSQQTVRSFKKELADAKKEAVELSGKFGDFSPQAIAAAKRFGELKEKLRETNELAGSLAGEGKIKAFANLGAGIAGGFSAIQGAIGLVSTDSKELEKTLLRVNSAIALANGLAQVSELGKMWNQAKAAAASFTVVQKANTVATEAAAVVQKLFTGAVNTTSTGFKLLKGAIVSTGIGALVVLVGELVANFDKVKAAVLRVVPGLSKVGEIIEKITNAITDFVGATSDASREADKLRESISGQNDAAQKNIELLNAGGAASKDVRKAKNDMYDDEIKRLERIQELGEASSDDKKALADVQFKKKLLAAESAKADREEAEKAKKDAEDKAKKAADERKANADKLKAEAEKRAAESDAMRQKEIDAVKASNEYELSLAKIKGEDTVALRQKQIDDEIELLKGSGPKFEEGIVALEREKGLIQAQVAVDNAQKLSDAVEAKKKEIADTLADQASVRDELAGDTEQAELDRLTAKYEKMREIVGGNEQLLTAIGSAEEEGRAAIKKKFRDLEVKAETEKVAALSNLIGAASNLFGKQTAAGKAIAVADATIKTYQGATAAIAATAGMGPFGVALGIAQAAVVVAMGLKNIKTILSTKIPGQGDGAMGAVASQVSAGSPAVSTQPTMEGVQSTLVQQNQQIVAGKDSMKAYVVESEITEKQERQRAITQTATF